MESTKQLGGEPCGGVPKQSKEQVAGSADQRIGGLGPNPTTEEKILMLFDGLDSRAKLAILLYEEISCLEGGINFKPQLREAIDNNLIQTISELEELADSAPDRGEFFWLTGILTGLRLVNTNT